MCRNPYTLPDHELEALLHDDAPCGDATTFALGISQRPGRLEFRARQAMTLCGVEEARRMGELRGLAVEGEMLGSGTRLAAGESFLTLTGEAGALHRVWKTAQTLMEYLSGIATCAADLLATAQAVDPQAALVCTRKNFPGTKAASLKAVLCAGASPHRLNLSETLLLFAEHRAFLGDEPPATTVGRFRQQWPERSVVVEVGSVAEALRWAAAGADILQLEKLPPAAVAELAATLAKELPTGVRLAVAGGVTPGNAAEYVRAGARILVSSAPYFAGPKDVAVTLAPL